MLEGQWIGLGDTDRSPLLRKTFAVSGTVVRAELAICGLGYYEAHLDGRRVGEAVLVPAWTNYDRLITADLSYPHEDEARTRVLYNRYDVTPHFLPGTDLDAHLLQVQLGNGWYHQTQRRVEGTIWYGYPKLLCQLDLHFADGSRQSIVSDTSWQACPSRLVRNNLYFGEVYDARLPEGPWTPAVAATAPSGTLQLQTCPVDKVVETLQPVRLSSGETDVYDLGQNLTGWIRITLTAAAGTRVTLRFAEELADGQLDFASTGGEKQVQQDVYFAAGSEEETWEPRFTWHGFRYFDVQFDRAAVSSLHLEGRLVHADVGVTGKFHSSHPVLNGIHQMSLWSLKTNFHSGVPSDCPHRERLGYTGDGHVAAEAGLFNFDLNDFYVKWLDDIADAQNPSTGLVPNTAPYAGGGGGPAWGSALVRLPWALYQHGGDASHLERHYAGMKRWMEFMTTKTDAQGTLLVGDPGKWYLGEWCAPGEMVLPKTLVNTYFYGSNYGILAQIAAILGRAEESLVFHEREIAVAARFNDEFLDRQRGCYSVGRQGADVFALAWGIVPAEYREAVANHVIRHYALTTDGHLDTGIFGTPLLFQVLTDLGHVELAYRLLTTTTYPGYGFMLERGATTLWECWEEDRGFYNYPLSHNHPMFASIDAWFYRTLAGIRQAPGKAGYRRLVLQPSVPFGLASVEASFESPAGPIVSCWTKKSDSWEWDINLPDGCDAEVVFPQLWPHQVTPTSGQSGGVYIAAGQHHFSVHKAQ